MLLRIFSILRGPTRLFAPVLRDRSGVVAVILALALSAIVGFAGLGTEVASWYYTQRAMQGATNAAASSAAAELAAATSSGSSVTGTQLSNTGDSIAASFHFVNGTANTTVTVNNPPTTTTNLANCSSPFTGFDCYVEVIISQPQTPLLTALFMSSGPTITTRAVALANIKATDAGCVLALNRHPVVDLSFSGNVNLNLSTCALYDNSSDRPGSLTMTGNSTVNAKAAYIVGTVETSGGATLNTTDGTFTGVNPVSDPYANVPVPTSSTQCPIPTDSQTGSPINGQQSGNVKLSGQTSAALANPSGACVLNGHDGITLSGQSSLALSPGIYIIDAKSGGSLTLSGGTSLTGTGVTIVLTNTNGGSPADIKISGGASVTLSAPTTGSTAGLALFQDRVACGSCSDQITGGSTMNITGAIYFPSNSVTFTGGTSTGGAQCTQLIASTITFTGNANFNSNCNSAGTKTISDTNGRLVM